ncbi:MAG: hypothetical protein IJL67_09640 [Oscillospiraceae bacterium]|nr:hypothetical protein [Oscillospiraceae bacterium]
MRKFMTVLSVVLGILTFAAVSYVGKDSSKFNAAFICIPALLCIMTAIVGDRPDSQHLDLDEVDADI